MQDLIKNFDNIRNFLRNKESELVRKYFFLLGYKYTSSIQNSNFFHFATEALLVTITKALNIEFIDVKNIPTEIFSCKIDENSYQNNLSFLLGTAEFNEHEIKFSYNKIASIFLTNFLTQRIHLSDDTKNSKDSKIIYNTLQYVLRESVNQTISELSCEENLPLHKVFTDLLATKENKVEALTLEDYTAAYSKEINNKESNNKFSVQNPAELFYFFAVSSIEDLLNDILSLNKQLTSVIYVVISLIKAQFNNKLQIMKNFYAYINSHYNTIKDQACNQLSVKYNSSKEQLDVLNKWVVSSYNIQRDSFEKKFPNVYAKIIFINNDYILPLSKSLLNYTDKAYSFVVKVSNENKGKITELTKKLIQTISETYKISYDAATKYVKISSEKIGNSHILKFSLLKLQQSRENLYKLLEIINKYIEEFNYAKLKETASNIVLYGKDTIMESYKKFLGCGDEKIKKESTQKEEVLVKDN